MIATRIFRLLLVALSILAAAEALNPRQGLVAGIRGALNIRQGGTNANTNTDTSTSETSQKATTANTTPTDTTATTTAPTTTHTQETTSSTPTSTQTTPTNTQTKTTPTNTQTQTTPTQTQTNTSPTTPTGNGNGNTQTTSSTTSEAAQITPTTSTAIIVITTTNSNGVSMVVTSSSISTGMATLSASSDNGDNQGMSSQTRNTIIGVVVGVGGAIILAVVGLIWWRVWGRKKDSEENDGLMGYGGYTAGAAEKPESLAGAHSGTMGSGSSRTPFQSTLESYHAPTQVNHASNF